MTDLSMDEMLRAIAVACDSRPDEVDDPGATREEMAKHWGVSPQEAGRRLTKGVREQRLIRGTRWVQNVNGTWRKVPVYRAA